MVIVMYHQRRKLILKDLNSFQHAVIGTYDYDLEIEFQIQIGSKLYPEYPIRSIQEAFTQLVKCLGINNSALHGVDIYPLEYRSHKFNIGIDTEKILEAGFTGINTKAGDLMVVKVKQASGSTQANLCNKMFITLHSDQILNIRDTGVDVFD